MVKTVKIGIVGMGNVGQGVYSLIIENKQHIAEKTGILLEIKKIAVKDKAKKRGIEIDEGLLTENIDEVVKDKEIGIVVELIGGYEKAREVVVKALHQGKYVVTANKLLMAKEGAELSELAEKQKTDLYFEASVAGGIPAIIPMSLSLCANRIESIHAILNGTCNYILSRMEEGLEFDEALKQAQEKGFAEKDPSLDINGTDAMQKLVILSSIAFGNNFKETDINTEGIEKIDAEDIEFADALDYRIKLLAIAKAGDKDIELEVAPFLIPKNHSLSSVRNELNAITTKGNFVGEVTFIGKGAGGNPTASAVVADIINAAQDMENSFEGIHLAKIHNKRNGSVRNPLECEYPFYIKLLAEDRVGVMAKVTAILAENNISIASAIQKGIKGEKEVPVIILTHRTKEKNLKNALDTILGLEFIKAGKFIRIEKFGN